MQPQLFLSCLAYIWLECALAHEELTAVAAPAPIEAFYAAPPLPSPHPLPLPLPLSLSPWHYDFSAFQAPTGYAAATPPNYWGDAAYAAHAYAATAPSHAAPYAPPPAHTAYAYAAAPVAPVAAAHPPPHYARARVRAHPVGAPITKHYVRIGYAYAGGAAPLAAPAAYAAAVPAPAAFRAPADTLPFGIIG